MAILGVKRFIVVHNNLATSSMYDWTMCMVWLVVTFGPALTVH